MVGMGIGIGLGFSNQNRAAVIKDVKEQSHELLLQAEITEETGRTNEGAIVQALSVPWLAIFESIKSQPQLLFSFAQHPEKFEEFIASAYEKDGWDRVILTPRSGDGGRDVIAEKGGFGAIRFIDQCKAFSKGRLVGQNDVRAMLGVLSADNNASKAVVTTTSDFTPGISTDEAIQQFVPNRLELRNGDKLIEWLSSIPK